MSCLMHKIRAVNNGGPRRHSVLNTSCGGSARKNTTRPAVMTETLLGYHGGEGKTQRANATSLQNNTQQPISKPRAPERHQMMIYTLR